MKQYQILIVIWATTADVGSAAEGWWSRQRDQQMWDLQLRMVRAAKCQERALIPDDRTPQDSNVGLMSVEDQLFLELTLYGFLPPW
ncbi:hypothetical protein B296_00025314 [Ensete ventricosum]|uniref:Secreted protein n=1 Tax=Ensete ventricosum TaxID=4639 RepID=A0A427ATF5_ENSVE|nr:hypothetical protein B296_00025314 [Ensete ventricosum]